MEPQLAAGVSGTAHLPGPPALRRRPSHPSTRRMVIEALQAQDQGKGASVIAIKRFILAKYPTVDPIRLKYLLKQALAKGLSCGELVRPANSAAMGATGRFKLAPEKLRQKQPPAQADPDGGQAPNQGQKGTAKPARAPAAGARQRGAAEQKPAAAKAKAKPVDALPPAAVKPTSAGAKPLPAAGQPQAPRKRRLGNRVAPAAEDAGEGDSSSAVGTGAKGPHKAPVGKSEGKAPKGAQPDPPKAKAGQGKARKPRVIPAAGQGEAGLRKAAPAACKKAP